MLRGTKRWPVSGLECHLSDSSEKDRRRGFFDVFEDSPSMAIC